MSQWRCSC